MISACTRTLAIIGDPIEHSLTPRIQNAAWHALGEDSAFVNIAFHVAPPNLATAVFGARSLGLLGLMVTIPHKEAVLALCDELHSSAQLLGAANLLEFRADGAIVGHSSDGWAMLESLREENVEVAGCNVTIIGGGGAARSLALTLADAGVKSLTILNRTLERAQLIAAEVEKHGVSVRAAALEREPLSHACENADLLINTTSVGMTPDTAATPIARPLLSPSCAVYDIVYNPLETRLLREAREIGARGVDGLGMLIYTNVYAARVCAHREISATVMREEAMRAFGEQGAGNNEQES